jgi:hypothetical protein
MLPCGKVALAPQFPSPQVQPLLEQQQQHNGNMIPGRLRLVVHTLLAGGCYILEGRVSPPPRSRILSSLVLGTAYPFPGQADRAVIGCAKRNASLTLRSKREPSAAHANRPVHLDRQLTWAAMDLNAESRFQQQSYLIMLGTLGRVAARGTRKEAVFLSGSHQ